MNNLKAGYFKIVPDFVAGTPVLVPWVQGARLVMLVVLAFGFYQAYKTVKEKYGVELESGQVSIRK